MDRQKHSGEIRFLDNLIQPFGKYGYLIIGSLLSVFGGMFIFIAVFYNNFISGVVALFFMFIVGYCWNKDSERVMNGKD